MNYRRGRTGALIALFALAAVFATACTAACFSAEVSAAAGKSGHCDSEGLPAPSGSQDTNCNAHGHTQTYLGAPAAPKPGLAQIAAPMAPIIAPSAALLFVHRTGYTMEAGILPGSGPASLFEKHRSLRI